MKLKIQIFSLLLIGFLHLYPCKKCRLEDVYVYDCSNLSLTDLPREGLGHVYKLDLSHNEITTLGNDAFLDRNLISIAILYVQDNKITTLEPNTFRGMSDLDFVNLNNNDIVDIPVDLFKSNRRLRFLRFENNTRLKLPQEGFDLPDLNILDLENCGLETIAPNFFEKMRGIEILYLRGNKLSYVNPMLITPLNELEFLDLRDNLFTKLQLDILRMSLPFKVSFTGNPLNCDCALLRAYSLYKKKAPFEDLSCKYNSTLVTDLTNITMQLDCYPSTTLRTTHVSNMSLPDTTNKNNSAYVTFDADSHDLNTTQQNMIYGLKEDEKDQTITDPSSLTPIHMGIIVMSIVILAVLGILAIIVINRKRISNLLIADKFTNVQENQEGEVNFSYAPLNGI